MQDMSRPLGPDRDLILDAAETLFAEHGFDAVSLRAISARANSKQSLVHYHFNGKIDLYRAVWDRWTDLPRPTLPEPLTLGHEVKSRDTHIRDAVADFFRGPQYLSSTPRGRNFLKIIIREFGDPKAEERGLLSSLSGDDRLTFIKRLSANPVNIKPELASALFKILGATVQIMITPDQLTEEHQSLIDFNMLIEFASGGIEAFARQASA